MLITNLDVIHENEAAFVKRHVTWCGVSGRKSLEYLGVSGRAA